MRMELKISSVRKSSDQTKHNLGFDDEKEWDSNRPTLFVLNVNISCTNFVTIKTSSAV